MEEHSETESSEQVRDPGVPSVWSQLGQAASVSLRLQLEHLPPSKSSSFSRKAIELLVN